MITKMTKHHVWIGALALLLVALFMHRPAYAQTGTVTIDLCATAGSAEIVTGTTVPVWGYTLGDCTVNTTPELPGPTLTVTEGDAVEVVLHNNLSQATALLFQGQGMIPDLVGAAPGGTFTYAFTATQPGTFLYEAGLLPNTQHQVAMGMAGVLIVRPAGAPDQAYTDPATSFTVEAPVILSEIDPALNNSADPSAFDMRDFAPRYWLINGKAYPDTANITATVTDTLLLRVVNAGLLPHSMGLLGLDQTLLATDGSPFPFRRDVVVQTVAPGQTIDFLVTMPAVAPAGGGHYAFYDTNLLLHNAGAAGLGGMLTFINLPDGGPPSGAGPTTTSAAVAPNPTDGSVDVILTATIPGATGAEYFINTQGAGGSGITMDPGVNPDQWTATLSVADLANLAAGDHILYVHGSDGTTWGLFNFAVLHLDKMGPMIRGVVFSPNPSDGSVDVALSATGDDSMMGNSNVIQAEYFVDTAGADGTGSAMTVTPIAPVASLNATLPAGLTAGAHTVYVHAMDAFGHWGELVTATLGIDQTGPETGNILLRPNPNNGALPYSPSQYSLRVDATISDLPALDVQSNVVQVEGFIDGVGADGTGFPLTPKDGLYNEFVEDAYAYIPLATINQLAEGAHQIWIHGRDASGNWGTPVAADLIIDKTLPTVSNVSATPNPTGGAVTATLTAVASDSASDIVMAEWFDGADPGRGNGSPMTVTSNGVDWDLSATIDVSSWAAGDHTLSVRARDAAGNWSSTVTYLLTVIQPDAIFADSFETGFDAWAATTGNVTLSGAAAMGDDGGTQGMAVATAPNAPGYVTDLSPAAEPSYHARFYFNPNGATTGNTQQTILVGLDGADNDLFRVQYRRRNAQGGIYEVRGWVQTAGGVVTTNWFVINNNAANVIEIAWESGAAASFSLYLNGGLQQTLTGLDTSAYLLETVLLGPSAGLINQASGTQYYDAFASRRYTVIGP